jgi:hypothetical protein
MKLRYYKRSALKFVSRIIPHKRGIIPDSLQRNVSKACVGVHTRDLVFATYIKICKQVSSRINNLRLTFTASISYLSYNEKIFHNKLAAGRDLTLKTNEMKFEVLV